MTTAEEAPTDQGRRAFFKWASAAGGLGAAVLAGLPALRAFLSPGLRRRAAPPAWIKLGEADQFDPGTPVKVDFVVTQVDAWIETRVQRSVWVYTLDGEHFTAYSGRCTHLGCSYAFDKDRAAFRCPCHQGVFDVKSGAVLAGPPPRGLDRLSTRIEDGALYVAYQDFRVGVPERIAV